MYVCDRLRSELTRGLRNAAVFIKWYTVEDSQKWSKRIKWYTVEDSQKWSKHGVVK